MFGERYLVPDMPHTNKHMHYPQEQGPLDVTNVQSLNRNNNGRIGRLVDELDEGGTTLDEGGTMLDEWGLGTA